MDKTVFSWIKQVEARNLPISGQLIQEKALQVAEEFDIHGFSASNGWLEKIKIKKKITRLM